MVAELRRAVDQYGFRAITLPSTAGGKALDDLVFEPFFSYIEKEGLVLILHPVSATPPTRYGIYGIQVLVGCQWNRPLRSLELFSPGCSSGIPC